MIASPYGPTFTEFTAYESSKYGVGMLERHDDHPRKVVAQPVVRTSALSELLARTAAARRREVALVVVAPDS